MHLHDHIAQLNTQGLLPGLEETIPTFRSLAIIIDPLVTTVDSVRETLTQYPVALSSSVVQAHNRWRLPVCYDTEYGPDLSSVAESTGLSINEVIDRHKRQHYQVYLLGFQPGYGFLGDTDPSLHLPRRTTPRVRVPAGSVAIAMKLTCVYPWECPGGWHLLGRCPIPMFDATADRPTLLTPNDQVRFESVDTKTYLALENDRLAGRINWADWQDGSAP